MTASEWQLLTVLHAIPDELPAPDQQSMRSDIKSSGDSTAELAAEGAARAAEVEADPSDEGGPSSAPSGSTPLLVPGPRGVPPQPRSDPVPLRSVSGQPAGAGSSSVSVSPASDLMQATESIQPTDTTSGPSIAGVDPSAGPSGIDPSEAVCHTTAKHGRIEGSLEAITTRKRLRRSHTTQWLQQKLQTVEAKVAAIIGDFVAQLQTTVDAAYIRHAAGTAALQDEVGRNDKDAMACRQAHRDVGHNYHSPQ